MRKQCALLSTHHRRHLILSEFGIKMCRVLSIVLIVFAIAITLINCSLHLNEMFVRLSAAKHSYCAKAMGPEQVRQYESCNMNTSVEVIS